MSDRHLDRAGLACAVAAFLMWGLFPLYWRPLSGVPALEVVAHRTAWGFLAVVVFVTARRGWAQARALFGRPRSLLALAGTAALIAVNWLTYIWAVTHGHVTESSLGYFINPLVNVLLGVVVLRERLSRLQVIAVGLAAAGVAILTVSHGRFPWIAVVLAVTFGLYGLGRKTVDADALTGLLVETAVLMPLAATYLFILAGRGAGALGTRDLLTDVLLVLSGAVTAVPLALFAAGARRLPLSTVGMIQYLSPTGQFLLAVAVFREPFGAAHAVTFPLIWAALALLTWDLKRRRPD